MADQAPTPNDAAEAVQNGTEAPENPAGSQELPEWAKKEVADARSEAARYRVEKNEAVDKAKADAKAQYDIEKADLEGRISKSESALNRLRIAVGAGISADKIETFAERLQGETEDELRKDAEQLKKLFSTPEAQKQSAVDPSQGSGNTHMALNGDPILAAVRRKVGVA